MAKPPADYPFENFPHGEIRVVTPRRKFLSTIMAEVHVFNKHSEGHIGRKLSDLGNQSDEDLYSVVPMVTPGCKISLQEGYVVGTPNGGRPLMLFPTLSPALKAFNLFDGINTLAEIAGTLAEQTGWSEEKAFAYARGVFLSLVMVGLCQPKFQ